MADGGVVFIFNRSIIGPLAALGVSVLIVVIDALLSAQTL